MHKIHDLQEGYGHGIANCVSALFLPQYSSVMVGKSCRLRFSRITSFSILLTF